MGSPRKAKLRVHELAADFRTTPEAILRMLQGGGFPTRSVSSRVDSFAEQWLRFEFTVEDPAPVAAERARPPSVPGQGPEALRRPVRNPLRRWSRRRARVVLDWPDAPAAGAPRRQPPGRTELALRGRDLVSLGLDLDAVVGGLNGSPYSLPDGQAEYLTTNFLPRVAALAVRSRRESDRMASARRATLDRLMRSSEIYESNRIEGLGPDLRTTHQVLGSHQLQDRTDISMAQSAIQRCLLSEPKVRDVVGLGAAKILAEIFCADTRRPLTESDIRQLHELLLVGDHRAGAYKQYLNRIDGSEHQPAAPSDTPAAMRELVSWLAASTLSPLWRAAVVHAWLTHIHPFHDGNGRVARLLANLVLIREGLPALIVRASGDRGKYLDALAASDRGGDILPLARLFRGVLSRGVQDLSNPHLAEQFLTDEITRRTVPAHLRWKSLLDEFLSELAPRLLLHRLDLEFIGDVRASDLERLGNGYRLNAWVAKVGSPGASRDLLLHVAPSSSDSTRHLAEGDGAPSIYVSVRNERPLDASQYLPVGRHAFTYEFTPIPSTGLVVVRRDRRVENLPIHEAAERAAEHLTRVHRQLIGTS